MNAIANGYRLLIMGFPAIGLRAKQTETAFSCRRTIIGLRQEIPMMETTEWHTAFSSIQASAATRNHREVDALPAASGRYAIDT